MHELVENEVESEKFLRWEALRLRVNTIGAREALDEAINQEGAV